MILVTRLWNGSARTGSVWSRIRWGLAGVAVIEALVAAPRFLSFVNVAAGDG